MGKRRGSLQPWQCAAISDCSWEADSDFPTPGPRVCATEPLPLSLPLFIHRTPHCGTGMAGIHPRVPTVVRDRRIASIPMRLCTPRTGGPPADGWPGPAAGLGLAAASGSLSAGRSPPPVWQGRAEAGHTAPQGKDPDPRALMGWSTQSVNDRGWMGTCSWTARENFTAAGMSWNVSMNASPSVFTYSGQGGSWGLAEGRDMKRSATIYPGQPFDAPFPDTYT